MSYTLSCCKLHVGSVGFQMPEQVLSHKGHSYWVAWHLFGLLWWNTIAQREDANSLTICKLRALGAEIYPELSKVDMHCISEVLYDSLSVVFDGTYALRFDFGVVGCTLWFLLLKGANDGRRRIVCPEQEYHGQCHDVHVGLSAPNLTIYNSSYSQEAEHLIIIPLTGHLEM